MTLAANDGAKRVECSGSLELLVIVSHPKRR
jgi:hypothetical protein